MFGILVILFTAVPLIELFLLFKAGAHFGGMNTFMIVLFTGVAGAALAKSQGISILNKIQKEMNAGQLPADQIIHGVMVFAGGLLLLTPGFMTDIMGFVFVMPGTRHLLIHRVKKIIEKAIKNGSINVMSNAKTSFNANFQTFGSSSPDVPTESLDGDVFEAEYTKKD